MSSKSTAEFATAAGESRANKMPSKNALDLEPILRYVPHYEYICISSQGKSYTTIHF